ncbi:MAG TPA: cupin domain-containing protein [Parapedobacter sp.]|nr:cupin domain-containing protein [Parapedobacter sp.]
MNFKNTALLFLGGALTFSCQQSQSERATQVISREPIFAKGEKITNDNFTGTAWLNNLVDADSLNQNAVGSVTFEPGARTNWHTHPAGQIILALDGVGYYQEQGNPKVTLRKGDVVKCPAGIPHWHGASTDTAFVQVAVTGREHGETVWLAPVTDEEYNNN